MQSPEMPFTVPNRCLAPIPRGCSGNARKCPTVEEIEQGTIRKSLLIKQELNLNKLRDFTLWSVSLGFEAILWRVSIRRGAFIRGERLIQSLHLGGGGAFFLDTRCLFESECLFDYFRKACCAQTRELKTWRHYPNWGELDQQRVKNRKKKLVCKTERLTRKFYSFIMSDCVAI